MFTNYPLFPLLFLLSILPNLASGQSPESLLERGQYCYQRDRLDSARIYYRQAQGLEDPNIKLQGIAGLIKVAVLETDMATADSLLLIGDTLLAYPNISLIPRCKYNLVKGEYFRKNSNFDKALRQHQRVLALTEGIPGAERTYGYAFYYTALTFERLSAYDSSLIYVNRAYDVLSRELAPDALEFGAIYNGMGACYYRSNRLSEAKNFYLKSIAITEEKLGPFSSDLAMCLNNLSSISRAEENYREAIAYGERALKIFRVLGDDQGVSGAYYSLGVYHYFIGDYGRTKDYMEACIAIREQLYNENHYSLIGPYEVLGIAYEESGNYEKTLAYLKKVRKKIGANYGAGSILEGFNYENTAICFKSIGQLDSSLHYIRRANAILTQQLPPNDYALAVHYFSYANILYQLNELNRAAYMLRKANWVCEVIGMTNSTEYAQNLGLEGLILAEQGNWNKAEQQFNLALNKIRLPNRKNLQEAAQFKMAPNTFWLLNEYTNFLFQKHQATADEEALQNFETYSGIYLDLSNKFRKQFVDPYTKSILIKDNAEMYERSIGIYNRLYRQTGKDAYLRAAYNFSEYGRTCLLRDLQSEKIPSYAGIPDSVLQREYRLRKQITQLNQQVLEYPDSNQIRRDLFSSKEALNNHIQATLKRYPRYHDLKFSTKVPALTEIQSRLSEGENIVEYMQDDTAYYALVIRPAAYESVYLGNRRRINQAIKDWKEQLVSRNDKAYTSVGRFLHRQLWAPLEDQLKGSRVKIIPVGPLFYLNFELLPTGLTPSDYLIHNYNLSYALSITVLLAEETASPPKSIVAIAPGFEETLKAHYRSELDSLEPIDKAYLRTVRQPWSLKLVEKLRNQFVNQSFTGTEATEANIKARIHQGNLLYFGTHAIADPSDPLRSRLILTKESGSREEDGYLHAYEIYGLPLQAELAVLNACESGLGSLQKGEGMISLAYSIQFAGCPSTVMSLWKVDEKTNTQITAQFLEYLDQGLTKSQALRQAKLQYLQQSEAGLKHPFYWGGMVLMGQDGTVSLQNKITWWPALLVVLTSLGILFYWAVMRRKAKEI